MNPSHVTKTWKNIFKAFLSLLTPLFIGLVVAAFTNNDYLGLSAFAISLYISIKHVLPKIGNTDKCDVCLDKTENDTEYYLKNHKRKGIYRYNVCHQCEKLLSNQHIPEENIQFNWKKLKFEDYRVKEQ